MKKVGSIISMCSTLALSLSMISAPSVDAAQVGLYGLKTRCFLEKNTSYPFALYSDEEIKDVQLVYHCQPIGGWNTNYTVDVATYHLNPPAYVFGQGAIDTSYIQMYGPWYNGGFIGNKMDFIVTHPDNSTSKRTIRCNVLDAEVSWYDDRDTTFYYTNPNSSSFISFKTGYASQFSGAVYNCLSYAIHAESEGWLWPFAQDQATNAETSYYLYTRGYEPNTLTNHTFANVIAYGTGQNSISHFAKVTDWSANGTPIEINSKWGGMEVLHSSSTTPFTNSSSYGTPQMYFNKINNNTASICYNSSTGTYYDCTYKTWDSANNCYNYIDVLPAPGTLSQSISEVSDTKTCSPKLAQIYNTYKEKIDNYVKTIPDYNSFSYVITDDESGAADELISASLPYWDEIVDIATVGGYKDFDSRTAQFVITNTLRLNVFYSEPEKYQTDIKEQLNSVSEAVNELGSDFDQDDCNTLKEKYGYLIIPALENIGKTDSFTLEKDDACKNVDELLKLCGSFK